MKDGKFVTKGTRGAKRITYRVEVSKLRKAGKEGAKVRWQPFREDVKALRRKQAREEKEKLKRIEHREFLKLKKRDVEIKKTGRAEYIKNEVEREEFIASLDGSFRWRDFSLPDIEKDTLQYAIGRVSRWFTYPVVVTIGIKGYDKDGNPCGRYKDNTIYTKVEVVNGPDIVDKIHNAAKELMARYTIELVAQAFIHVSESKRDPGHWKGKYLTLRQKKERSESRGAK